MSSNALNELYNEKKEERASIAEQMLDEYESKSDEFDVQLVAKLKKER